LSFKFQLDWTYYFGYIAIVKFWQFDSKMPIRAYFSGFGESWPPEIVISLF